MKHIIITFNNNDEFVAESAFDPISSNGFVHIVKLGTNKEYMFAIVNIHRIVITTLND